MLKVANSVIDASRITGVLPVVNGGTGVTTSTGTGNTVLSATPTLSGNVTLSTGNLIPSTAAKGINFTANTPSAGMTSQLLNWYEEGTWTPTISGGSPSGQTYSTQSGKYTRIGNIVYAEFFVALSAAGTTGTGSGRIGGLPFNALGTSAGAIFSYWSGLTGVTAYAVYGSAISNYIELGLQTAVSTAVNSGFSYTYISNTTRLQGSITYTI